MEKININDYFVKSYLTPGKTRDNFVATDCPKEFMDIASKLLSRQSADITSVVITITRDKELLFEKTLSHAQTDYQKKLLARDFFCTLFEMQLNAATNRPINERTMLAYKALISGNLDFATSCHADCPMPYEIFDIIRRTGKTELNAFLYDTQNKYIQESINDFLSMRIPVSVKLFTNNEMLPTYLDSSMNIVQSPHDFMTINIDHFIEFSERED